MSIPVPYASGSTPSLRERVNMRLVVFVGVFALIFGFIAWTWLEATLTGGIKHAGDHVEVDLKAMSSFPMNQQTGTINDVPPEFRALDGKTVVLVGEQAPGATQTDGMARKFDLVYSVQNCCYTGDPQIQHFVHITVPPEAAIKVGSGRMLRVKGVLKVDVTRDAELNKITGVYHVTASEIESIDV